MRCAPLPCTTTAGRSASPVGPYARVQAPPDYRWTPGQVEVPVYDGLPYPLWGLTARITRHVVQRATEGAE